MVNDPNYAVLTHDEMRLDTSAVLLSDENLCCKGIIPSIYSEKTGNILQTALLSDCIYLYGYLLSCPNASKSDISYIFLVSWLFQMTYQEIENSIEPCKSTYMYIVYTLLSTY